MSGAGLRADAREVALAVVRDVFGPEHRAAQAAFDVRARKAALDARDRAFAAELAYGAIKARRLLDWYLAPYVGARERTLPPTIVEILRLGTYQLRCMGGVEPHAAVFETVKLALRHGHKGTGGLVNAVLRRMIADATPPPDRADFENDADFAATVYSVPTWIAAQFGAVFDGRRDAVLEGINRAPQSAVRVNRLKLSVAEASAVLAANRTVLRSPFVEETLLVDGAPASDDPTARWIVQGEAACMPVDVLAPQPGEHVIELCAGRGHKSVQIAARMQATGRLDCVERNARNAAALRTALVAAGAEQAGVVEADAAQPTGEPPGDAVLLDAPCSGVGILGRHPEARWRKAPGDGARLAAAQAALLHAAAARTRAGGRLVYSVCSTDPREGVAVVDAFLAENAFVRAPFPERYAPFVRGGDLLVPPGIDGRDGFFIASLVREP